jgi:5'-3' exonuclease
MCIMQYKSWQDGDTIICSRDKDVRQCPGLHYSWEVAKQAAIGPIFVEPLGHLEKVGEGKTYANGKPKPIKLFGTGHKFFYAQLLMGDKVDNIGGVVGRGPVFAYNLLHEARSERELYELVAELYVKTYGDDWKVRMKEQADLLWMVRELDEKGDKVLWMPPSTGL